MYIRNGLQPLLFAQIPARRARIESRKLSPHLHGTDSLCEMRLRLGTLCTSIVRERVAYLVRELPSVKNSPANVAWFSELRDGHGRPSRKTILRTTLVGSSLHLMCPLNSRRHTRKGDMRNERKHCVGKRRHTLLMDITCKRV